MKIAVAMSGGIDSTMAALLLKEQGHEVTGITAVLFAGVSAQTDDITSLPSVRDALWVSRRYGFPLEVEDLREEFSKKIITPFCAEYMKGRTPNPCIECNVMIKFSLLFDAARRKGCEKLATGHYVKLKDTPQGRMHISMNTDPSKDQSYFLYRMTQEQLRRSLFPLGDFTKTRVVSMAKDRGIELAGKAESQEICFIPDNDYPGFIEARVAGATEPGDIVDMAGKVIGRHAGIHRYTIGQRRGLGISAEKPLYVTGIDYTRNIIIAGNREDLAVRSILIRGIAYMKSGSLHGIKAMVKTRSTQKPSRAGLMEREGGVVVTFDEPQYGISPGQSAVFYDEEGDVLGGGYIERVLPIAG